MTGYARGDLVLYRDRDRFNVAQVMLARDGHVAALPFNAAHKAWYKGMRRVPHHLIVRKLRIGIDVAALIGNIEFLRHQRDVKRQQANAWLVQQVEELAEDAA